MIEKHLCRSLEMKAVLVVTLLSLSVAHAVFDGRPGGPDALWNSVRLIDRIPMLYDMMKRVSGFVGKL